MRHISLKIALTIPALVLQQSRNKTTAKQNAEILVELIDILESGGNRKTHSRGKRKENIGNL